MPPRMTFLQHSDHDVPGVLGQLARDVGCEVRAVPGRPGRILAAHPGDRTTRWWCWVRTQSTLDTDVPWIGPERALIAGAVTAGIPVLGVCFGGQLLAQALGGEVTRATRPEIGWYLIETSDPDRIPPGPWLEWHEDAFTAPPGSEAVARSRELPPGLHRRHPHRAPVPSRSHGRHRRPVGARRPGPGRSRPRPGRGAVGRLRGGRRWSRRTDRPPVRGLPRAVRPASGRVEWRQGPATSSHPVSDDRGELGVYPAPRRCLLNDAAGFTPTPRLRAGPTRGLLLALDLAEC